MAQNWLNKDGLFLQYGTDKTVPETAGDFLSYGANRIVEGTILLTSLSTTAIILSYTTLFQAPPTGQMYIEAVELIVETAATTSSSATLDLGLIQTDQATVPSNYGTAFVNALAQTALTPAGVKLTLVNGSTGAGGLIGSSPANATGPYYLTAATGTGTFTAGSIRYRILYHADGVITQ